MKKNTKTSRRVTAPRLRDSKGRFMASTAFAVDPRWNVITPYHRLLASQTVRAADTAIEQEARRLDDDAKAAYMAICQSRPSAPVAEYVTPRRGSYGGAVVTILFLILMVGGCVALAH